MKLIEILKGVNYKLLKGALEIDVTDLCYDSRQYQKNNAFICLEGIDTDGHKYISDVIKKGCKCLIVRKEVEVKEDITIVKLENTRTSLSHLSANFFSNPQEKLFKIAITGTKGKTSTSFMIKKILEEYGQKVGVIGTLGTIINGKTYEHKNTTPESYQVQKYMKMMVDEGVKYLIMETSSQALQVGRVNNILYEVGIFTNLSIDHIGPREHKDFNEYKLAKAKLFKQCKIGIFNKDDKFYPEMIKNATCKIYTYGKTGNPFEIRNITPFQNKNLLGMQFQLKGKINTTFKVASPGEFSVYNASASIALATILKIPQNIIKKGLLNFNIPGRSEIINLNNQVKVVIDFAHNKISMESIINTMKNYSKGKIITLFGCGGGRSYDRRYELGYTSGKLSDLSIITTDNPRWDNISEINHDIEQGILDAKGNYKIIPDRKEAIQYSLTIAKKGDIILLLGKGHEKYQEIKGEKQNFDEKEIINNFIKERLS